MSSSPTIFVTLVGITQDPDGTFTIYDSQYRAHQAETPAGLGKIIARLVADEELPKSKLNTDRDKDVGFAAELARRVTGRVAPELTDLIDSFEPAAHAIVKVARNRPRRRGSRRGVARS